MYESMWYRGSRGDDEKSWRMMGASIARSTGSWLVQPWWLARSRAWLTMAFNSASIYASTSHQYIVYDREDAFTSHPLSCFILDLAVIEDGRFVELDAPSVDCLSKRYFVGVEIFPARPPNHIFWLVAQYVSYRVRGI